jgi:hypothetical protein
MFAHPQKFWTAPLPIRIGKHVTNWITTQIQKDDHKITLGSSFPPSFLPSSSLQTPMEGSHPHDGEPSGEGCTLERRRWGAAKVEGVVAANTWGRRRGRGGDDQQRERGVIGTRVPDLPSGEDNYRFGGDVTQMIRLPINTTRTPQSQHHFSSGYQPCTARLTSPRGLIPARESKTQARTRKNTI